MIWFGWFLWLINHYRLFDAKSSLYIYIKYIGFGWVLWHIKHCRRWPWCEGGARGVMVIIIGNGHGNTSSNPGPD